MYGHWESSVYPACANSLRPPYDTGNRAQKRERTWEGFQSTPTYDIHRSSAVTIVGSLGAA